MAARNNPGNQWTNKVWRDAIRVAALRPVDEAAKPKTRLDRAASALVDAATEGDVAALKEMGDRLDGRVPQALVGGDDDAPPIRTITEIRRTIVDPGKKGS